MLIPVHIWGYALRIWLAAVTALYAAFWLQLGGASSAAVTVAILAQPTRGAALAKAVNKGDILHVIEKSDFEVALDNAKATILNREADLAVKKAQNTRREALTTLSTSIEEKQVFDGNAKMAEAALASAKAALSQAEINLQRTEVRSPVGGYVTNLLMRVGDYARAGTPNVSVIDENSYWIDAYFEETKLANIHVGDAVEAMLLGYEAPIRGRIESITGGISAANAASSTQGLPNVDPIFTWVRLAQRIPVRIRIEQIPQDVPLIAGRTCSVTDVGGKEAPAPKHDQGIFDRLISRLG
jgi:multidrug resistance efflux pump